MNTAAMPSTLRRQVDGSADAWLTASFSRLVELRARNPGRFNDPVAVFSEWGYKASTSTSGIPLEAQG